MSGGGARAAARITRGGDGLLLTPELGPPWLRPLVDNVGEIPDAYRRRLPADVLAMVTASKAAAGNDGRDAAVLVLFSGPRQTSPAAPRRLPS